MPTIPAQPELPSLIGDVTRSDLAYELGRLPLRKRDSECLLRLDREVRDYLLSLLHRTSTPPTTGARKTYAAIWRSKKQAERKRRLERLEEQVRIMNSVMSSFTDYQLDMVMRAAAPLPIEKRSVYLERIAAHLHLHRPLRRRGS